MKRVYFIKPVGMDGPIKIGCSLAPGARRKTLELWSPFPLEIIAETDGGEFVERQFHHRHRSSHQRQEWFAPSELLLADIAQISAGEFDRAILPPPQLLPRKPKDNSYITPDWKYRRSVLSRISHCVDGPEEVSAILGGNWHTAQFLPHREQLEAMVARLLKASPRPKRRAA